MFLLVFFPSILNLKKGQLCAIFTAPLAINKITQETAWKGEMIKTDGYSDRHVKKVRDNRDPQKV